MKDSLLKKQLLKILLGVILIGVLIFLPAWDIRWKEGRILMAVLGAPVFRAGL